MVDKILMANYCEAYSHETLKQISLVRGRQIRFDEMLTLYLRESYL